LTRKLSVFRSAVRRFSPAHLHEAQAAFSGRSCTDNLFVLTRILQELVRPNKTVYAFFLDVRKAYDTVLRMGCPPLLEKRCGWKVMAVRET
jgi:hypothetical protein